MGLMNEHETQAQDDFDYLMADQDKDVLARLAKMGEHLKSLKLKMLEAEAALEAAKKDYTYYSSSVLPMEMFNAGITSLELVNGGKMSYNRKFYCKPNKNVEDKRVMAAWLRQHGGSHLIKEVAQVESSKIDDLKRNNIPYAEIDDINTASLKAFLSDKIGAKGGTAQINIQDIPACMHFQEVGDVTIEV